MLGHRGPVIFDFDGTLVDSESLYAEAMHLVLLGVGISVSAQILRQRFVGIDNDAIFKQLSIEWNQTLSVDVEQKLQQTVEDLMQSGLKPIKGAKELLLELSESNVPLAVASNSTSFVVHRMLAQSRLNEFFEGRVATRDLVSAPKPAPDVYLLAARMLASRPEMCLVVEDSVTGVAAARAAGMKVIGFSPQAAGCSSELLVHAGASRVITELGGLLAIGM
jgi:HAD superfamily hydrolase (TIGR01509 family)